MVTWLFYRESCKAEDYTVLAGRLSGVLPDMCRLFNHGEAGELLLDGVPTGVFVKFVLVADKPFIRHVCGLLSHNADAFGAPFCECCDETDRPALYDFTLCTETHYGGTTFADLCHRAHCAPYVLQAATMCATSCNRMCYRLQPCVLHAATVYATRCNRMCLQA